MPVVLNPSLFNVAASGVSVVGSATGASTVVIPAAAQAGDLCLIFCDVSDGSAATGGGSGSWTVEYGHGLTFGNQIIYKKLLTSGDPGATITPGACDACNVIVIRGATSATQKQLASASGASSATITGFSPRSGSHKGVICYATKSNSSSTGPTGFTDFREFGGDHGTNEGCYNIDGTYSGGQSLTWTYGVSGGVYITVYELT